MAGIAPSAPRQDPEGTLQVLVATGMEDGPAAWNLLFSMEGESFQSFAMNRADGFRERILRIAEAHVGDWEDGAWADAFIRLEELDDALFAALSRERPRPIEIGSGLDLSFHPIRRLPPDLKVARLLSLYGNERLLSLPPGLEAGFLDMEGCHGWDMVLPQDARIHSKIGFDGARLGQSGKGGLCMKDWRERHPFATERQVRVFEETTGTRTETPVIRTLLERRMALWLRTQE